METTATITRPTARKLVSSLQNGHLALKQRFKTTKPQHRDCFGDEAFSLKTGAGTIRGWRLRGELATTAESIRQSLLTIVYERRDQWRSWRPETQSHPSMPSYTLESFLVGKDTSHATPHVAVMTRVEWFSKYLRHIILRSNFLRGYPEWGCFRLPADVISTAGSRPSSTDPPLAHYGQLDVYATSGGIPVAINGMSIEVWRGEARIGRGTVGGIVEVGQERLGLSVAHVFLPLPEEPSQPDGFEVDDDELSIFTYI